MAVVTAIVMALLLIGGPTDPSRCLTLPVAGAITSRFITPACPYCAGHRTVDVEVRTGAEVVAPISGVVTFAGAVAGTDYITIAPTTAHAAPGGIETTRLVSIGGAVADPEVVAGAFVTAGRRLGEVATSPIRLSLRRIVPGEPAEYLDPEPSLLRWRTPARLVPGPGVAQRAVVPTWTCSRPL